MKPYPAGEPPTPLFARRFAARAGPGGLLSFADFMELALFDPEAGYYARPRSRVGGAGADFFTSTSIGNVFGHLVAAAADKLLGGERARQCAFVEIGNEPDRPALAGVAHPFPVATALPLGSELRLPAEAVVFSNELLDAQPFHRLVFRAGAWREQGVALLSPRGRPALEWRELDGISEELGAVRRTLPAVAPEGYVLDVPWRAVELLRQIVGQPWRGLFLTFDYGRTWPELLRDHPGGTGRAYASHRQRTDLLANAGEQDLTCHLCWDWLEQTLREAGFAPVVRQSQEAFLVHHATTAIASILEAGSSPLAPARSQLKQLLHPSLMGQRFEALWAVRDGTRGTPPGLASSL